MYKPPEEYVIGEKVAYKENGSKITKMSTDVKMCRVPLKHSLTSLFSIDGLLDATLHYMHILQQEIASGSEIISNFVQGEEWITFPENFNRNGPKNGVAIPLVRYFDDLETGDPLSGHAGQHKIGAVYTIIPCFPPNFASKLQSISLTDVFHSSDRILYGNEAVFKHLIEESNYLQKHGLTINLTGKEEKKLYFITTIISSDNLGCNQMFGFVASFNSNSRFCRMCYAVNDDITSGLKVEEKLLRSVKQYDIHIKNINTTLTGIQKPCAFNKIQDWHVIKCLFCDTFHDLHEGLCNCGMAKITLTLIDELKCFSEGFLNHRLNSLD